MGDHPHSHALDASDPERYAISRRVTWVSVFVNLVLTVAHSAQLDFAFGDNEIHGAFSKATLTPCRASSATP